ncbi:hypothetical protein GGH96_001348 [Coemansia sp. RSA 1972]|nr:hypothetical protein GGH96_001348 [Coemansia sp. RSA 1972]
MFTFIFFFFIALFVHTLAAARALFTVGFKIVLLCVGKELATVPVAIIAEIQQQLDAQMRYCAELQLLITQEDETLADLHKQDEELMRAHAGIKMQTEEYVRVLKAKKIELQELKMKFGALVDERDELIAINLNLQDDLELRAE